MEKGKGREIPCSAWAESAAFCRHHMLSNPDATLCLPFLPLPFLPSSPLFLVFSAVSFSSFTAYFDFCQLFLDLPPFFLLSQLLSFRLFLFLTFFILVMFLIVSMRAFLFFSLSVTPLRLFCGVLDFAGSRFCLFWTFISPRLHVQYFTAAFYLLLAIAK